MEIDYNRLCHGCFSEKSTPVCPYCGYNPAAPADYPLALPAGSVLNGKYMVGKVLGQGGFGITYLGFDLTLQIKVAIKEYMPSGQVGRTTDHNTVSVLSQKDAGGFEAGKEKFLDEARILAKLQNSPNIVKVQNYFHENNTAYFVMEYIEGTSLKDSVARQGGRISYQQAESLLLPIAEALGNVHAQNLLHRDISPDNIFVTQGGQSKLLDFGAARFAMGDQKSLSVILKHGFAPEEQYRSHGNQGPWTDVYALGATFYNAITGALPPDAIERLHNDTLLPPSALGVQLPPHAEAALYKALAVKAENRFHSMAEFIAALTGRSPVAAAAAQPGAVSGPAPYAPPPSGYGAPTAYPSQQQPYASQQQPYAPAPQTPGYGQPMQAAPGGATAYPGAVGSPTAYPGAAGGPTAYPGAPGGPGAYPGAPAPAKRMSKQTMAIIGGVAGFALVLTIVLIAVFSGRGGSDPVTGGAGGGNGGAASAASLPVFLQKPDSSKPPEPESEPAPSLPEEPPVVSEAEPPPQQGETHYSSEVLGDGLSLVLPAGWKVDPDLTERDLTTINSPGGSALLLMYTDDLYMSDVQGNLQMYMDSISEELGCEETELLYEEDDFVIGDYRAYNITFSCRKDGLGEYYIDNYVINGAHGCYNIVFAQEYDNLNPEESGAIIDILWSMSIYELD